MKIIVHRRRRRLLMRAGDGGGGDRTFRINRCQNIYNRILIVPEQQLSFSAPPLVERTRRISHSSSTLNTGPTGQDNTQEKE